MGSRYSFEGTPAGRLAAIAIDTQHRITDNHKHPPDFADFRDAFMPFIELELLYARLAEARKCHDETRIAALQSEIRQALRDIHLVSGTD